MALSFWEVCLSGGLVCKSYPLSMLHKLFCLSHFLGGTPPHKLSSGFRKLCGVEACLIAFEICDAQIIFFFHPFPKQAEIQR